MALGIKPGFNYAQIRRNIETRLRRIDKAVLTMLQRIGEQFVLNSRETQTYTDRTGNLRSSIGYIILKDGQQIYENFSSESTAAGRSGDKKKPSKDGIKEARRVAKEASKDFPKGYVLIGVAGMDYAASVERKGFDVITASSKIAEKDLLSAISRITAKINRST